MDDAIVTLRTSFQRHSVTWCSSSDLIDSTDRKLCARGDLLRGYFHTQFSHFLIFDKSRPEIEIHSQAERCGALFDILTQIVTRSYKSLEPVTSASRFSIWNLTFLSKFLVRTSMLHTERKRISKNFSTVLPQLPRAARRKGSLSSNSFSVSVSAWAHV